MGWNTYVINETGQDVYCFWITQPLNPLNGWDVVNFHVPAGHSCSANRGGTCLFGFGAMFVPYPPPPGSSNPLGTPTGGDTTESQWGGPTSFDGTALNGVPLLWSNFDSSMGDACAHWGFRLVFNASGFQTTVGGAWQANAAMQDEGDAPTTWTYPGPTVAVAESQNWTSGSGMFAAYPASTSGCP